MGIVGRDFYITFPSFICKRFVLHYSREKPDRWLRNRSGTQLVEIVRIFIRGKTAFNRESYLRKAEVLLYKIISPLY